MNTKKTQSNPKSNEESEQAIFQQETSKECIVFRASIQPHPTIKTMWFVKQRFNRLCCFARKGDNCIMRALPDPCHNSDILSVIYAKSDL